MSPRARIVTLNLGSQSIELAEFRAQPPNGLVLCGYRTREFLAEPMPAAQRNIQIVAALREMLSELQIKAGPVNYTVAEESVFARFVKLPALGEEKIERIISFEAQQNVPYPIDEVVWDYQLVSGGVGEQIQVVLVAIKRDLLDEINSVVEATGLRTAIVDLATMALYNAFRHNYGEANECSLLIDIGARTTNLLFIEPGKIFTRSIPIGGSSVTAGIAKEFNESFAAAESRKRRDGFAEHMGVSSDSPNRADARVVKIVRGTMTRLHGEIMRSIGHYCAQQQGHPPARVFLAGGGATAPSIQEFFQEKLQLPVELFNSLRNVVVGNFAEPEEISRSAHLLGEPVGLALRAAIDCPMKLNLRPAGVVSRHEREKRRPFLTAAAACFVLGLLGCGVYYGAGARVLRQNTEKIMEKVVEMQRIELQLDEVRRKTAAVDSQAAPLIAAINDRCFWPQTLEELNARLPKENIWITDLLATSGGVPLDSSSVPVARVKADQASAGSSAAARSKPAQPSIDGILVRGLYLFNPRQQEVVVDYFRNLVDSPWFAIDPNNQAKAITPSTPSNTEWAFAYELRLNLRTPVKLP